MAKYDHITEQLSELNKTFEIREFGKQIAQDLQDEYPNTNSQKQPYAAIRKAVKEVYPDVLVADGEMPEFPAYWTNSGKGSIERYEHIFLLYLSEFKAVLNAAA